MSNERYNRKNVYKYAEKWAYDRNPKYYNFDSIGGDCTNFVSQCIFSGLGEMNYSKSKGWYYINGNNKSPSWTGVEFLYNFLISNKGAGPYGKETLISDLKIGDVIQLSFDGIKYNHSLIVIENGNSVSDTLIAAHTFDVWGKRVADYNYSKYKCIHIL